MATTKKIIVTVDGKPYEVIVEIPSAEPVSAAPSILSSASSAAPTPAPAPVASAETSTPSSEGAIVSPLSGLVAAVGVKVGQEVKEGEHVLTLEAMKMNTFVFSPKNGKIKEIHTESGAAVQEGQVLMVLE